jgi:hypothetical protein
MRHPGSQFPQPHQIHHIVIPAKAGIQLHFAVSKLDPDFRLGDE